MLAKNEKIINVITQTYDIENFREAFEIAANSRLSSKVMIKL